MTAGVTAKNVGGVFIETQYYVSERQLTSFTFAQLCSNWQDVFRKHFVDSYGVGLHFSCALPLWQINFTIIVDRMLNLLFILCTCRGVCAFQNGRVDSVKRKDAGP